MSFTDLQLEQFNKKGISEQKVLSQIETFKKGIASTNLFAAATINDGIVKLNEEDLKRLEDAYKLASVEKSVLRFVPASGAASRMFKFLFNFLDSYNPKNESLGDYLERTSDLNIQKFNNEKESFPFNNSLLNLLSSEVEEYDKLSEGEKLFAYVDYMLNEKGLNFGNLPKGVLPFHNYGEDVLTAFEEHLLEAALCTSKGVNKLHFTISENHTVLFETLLAEVVERVENRTGSVLDITFSYQKSSTDTVAVNLDNTLFEEDGKVLFRPSGHGALIENLNDLDADVVFVKNIDNVVVEENRGEVALYKNALAGLLLEVQTELFGHLNSIDSGFFELENVIGFLDKINIKLPEDFYNWDLASQIDFVKNALDKPLRVCGMVKNEGEPGGGPFWVENSSGKVSLQIVESAQMDLSDATQERIVANASHFNPVDLVCGLKNYKGESFNLLDYVDHETAFISSKTKSGKELKALELPGLWNGAMGSWNTLFVEVPLVTFNPVKTVNDLLKPSHQVKSKNLENSINS